MRDDSKNISQSELKEILNYDPLTGVFTWASAWGERKAGDVAGCANGSGCIKIRIGRLLYSANRLAFLYMTGFHSEIYIYNLNGDKSDNRWLNLREMTRGEVSKYSKPKKVVKKDSYDLVVKYCAAVKIDDIFYTLGDLDTRAQANDDCNFVGKLTSKYGLVCENKTFKKEVKIMTDQVSVWRDRVGCSRDEFLASWTMARFKTVDGELYGRVLKQIDLFDEACVIGSVARVAAMGEGMRKGWAAAVARMNGEPVCSFLKGVYDGVDVAIVSCEAARSVALDALGGKGVVVTPDEVAAVICGMGEGFMAIKDAFPDCVVQRVVDRG